MPQILEEGRRKREGGDGEGGEGKRGEGRRNLINRRKKVIRQHLYNGIQHSTFSVQCAVFACWHFLLEGFAQYNT